MEVATGDRGSVKVVVGLALFAATSALSLGGLWMRSKVYDHLTYDHFDQSVMRENYPAGQELLQILENPLLVSDRKGTAPSGASSLLSVAEELAQGRVENALSGLTNISSLYPELYEKLAEEAGSLSKILEELRQWPEKEANLLQEQERALQKLNLMREDLEDLFGLPPHPLNEVKTYTEGALRGLPVLNGIPAISDFVELRELLPSLGGGVKFDGPDAATLFSTRIEGAREGSMQAVKSYMDAHKELRSLRAGFEAALVREKESQRRLFEKTVREVKEKVRPPEGVEVKGWIDWGKKLLGLT